jgi:hypothetical protein
MPGRPPGGQASAWKASRSRHHQCLKPRPRSQKTAFLDSRSHEARHALALALARLMFAVGKVAVFHIGMPPVTIPVLVL